jgi:choloylglycine hydrolase
VFWVDLDGLDFAEGAAPMWLELGVDMERVLSGEVSAAFAPAAPFAFQPAG